MYYSPTINLLASFLLLAQSSSTIITSTGTFLPFTRPTLASNSTFFTYISVRYPNTTTTVIFTPGPTNTTTIWTTIPIASITGDPFCINQASPQQGIGNHCVCSNGATLNPIPWTKGGNISDYQPCAYTTVDVGGGRGNTTTVVVVGGR
ncbi:hypothetical protein QBC38DRAFT_118674 [Podospora fimiseda]|uniref:Uncharacterized protein n=1 Tax=Podospora fimiseda TaxID=252190 RepID=A0AAN7BTE3_9PEZI|nr:hypothetical protein QBC38DRAFT_118674 [Podospora fimiseda]